jgi:hypothetical protein
MAFYATPGVGHPIHFQKVSSLIVCSIVGIGIDHNDFNTQTGLKSDSAGGYSASSNLILSNILPSTF